MTKKEIKQKIWDYEYYINGFRNLSGTGVRVLNLRTTKTKAIADIELITDAENGNFERYNNCEYDLTKI